MNKNIPVLLELQKLDRQADELQSQIDVIPKQIEEITATKQNQRQSVEDKKKQLIQAKVDYHQYEIDLETKEQTIKKHNSELNIAKTNEQYRALLSEIEHARQEKKQVEDKMLEKMQEIEELGKSVIVLERECNENVTQIDLQIQTLEQKKQELTDSLSVLTIPREQLRTQISSQVYEYYRTLRDARQGLVIVPLDGIYCSGCRMLVPTQLVTELKKSAKKGIDYDEPDNPEKWIACETCCRVLYYHKT